jgi:hypothetical protein
VPHTARDSNDRPRTQRSRFVSRAMKCAGEDECGEPVPQRRQSTPRMFHVKHLRSAIEVPWTTVRMSVARTPSVEHSPTARGGQGPGLFHVKHLRSAEDPRSSHSSLHRTAAKNVKGSLAWPGRFSPTASPTRSRRHQRRLLYNQRLGWDCLATPDFAALVAGEGKRWKSRATW